MSFLGRILKFLFWVLVVSWAVRVLGRVIGAGSPRTEGPKAGAAPQGAKKRLVRDPVCGMHMAEELALPLEANGETLHFCSEECRARYRSSMTRRASA
jgi:YHS domain-containing protein